MIKIIAWYFYILIFEINCNCKVAVVVVNHVLNWIELD